MFNPRMVENFFKRTKFRRSKRLRSSLRASLIKKSAAAAAAATAAAAAASSGGSRGAGAGRGGLIVTTSISSIPATSQTSLSGYNEITSSCTSIYSEVGETSGEGRGVVGVGGGGGQCGDSTTTGVVEQSASSSFSTAMLNTSSAVSGGGNSVVSAQSISQRPSRPRTANCSGGQLGSFSSHPLSATDRSLQGGGGGAGVVGGGGEVKRLQASAGARLVESLGREVETLRTELAASRQTVTKLQEREKKLRDRLSEQAQRQLEKGTSKFEDISLGDNRPTQLIKRYGNLYAEGRLEAMDALDELPEMSECEDLKSKLLLSVIVLAFRSAQHTFQETKDRISEWLHIPRVAASPSAHHRLAAKDVEDTISLYLRKTVERHDVTKNYEEVCDRVWATLFDYPFLRDCHGLLHYIDECVKLAWAVTIQNPPLVIDFESKTFDEELHQRFHTSDAESGEIRAVLWPMLTEGENGPCIYRGVVVT